MTAHPGAFCSPPGGTDVTTTDTPMICSVGPAGGRARWRRNGPSPTRPRRPRRSRGKRAAATAVGGTLPQVDLGINPDRAVPEPAAADPRPVDDRIRDAYRQLAAAPGRYVNLADLRDKLPDIPRDQLDKALTSMLERDPDTVSLEPEPFGHRIDDRAKTSALNLGGDDRHKIALADTEP